MIANCSHDERGKYYGGKAGDQTGQEYVVRGWYNRPWSGVLRYPDKTVRKEIAKLARAAAKNNKIGYDQHNRLTFDAELRKTDDPAKITVACETDCTASTAAIIRCAGRRLGLKNLEDVNPSMYSGNAKPILKAAGFKWLSAAKYKKSDKYLLPGDVLLYIGHHAAINLDTGSKVGKTATAGTTEKTLRRGSKGAQVKEWQKFLNSTGAVLVVDGDFGARTEAATKKFQADHGLETDGIYGPKTRAAMKEVTKMR